MSPPLSRKQTNAKQDRLPVAPPPFSVKDLRQAIPAHCFERSAVKSFGYLFVDLLLAGLVLSGALFVDSKISEDTFGSFAGLLHHGLWLAYWIVQGCIFTGLWVIGHECGHGGFSSSETVCDAVGLVIHSLLLVPYFSWKISHRKHHSNTGNLSRDEVFVPAVKDEVDPDSPWAWSLPARLFNILVTFTLGWPGYLWFNLSGHKYPKGRWVNHFSPQSPIFSSKERHLVLLSDIALACVLFGVYQFSTVFGFWTVVKVYIVPYLLTNFWLVLITLLQHTDTYIAHYDDKHWDWLRGALATVDRDYGMLNVVFHHIADTHIAHHLFSTIPHYHAEVDFLLLLTPSYSFLLLLVPCFFFVVVSV